MKLIHKSFNMLAVATLLAFSFGVSSCNDDEPLKDPETEIPEKGNGLDFLFDDALYFEDNFFGIDSLGNSYDRKVGYALDPADPKHLYVGAESAEDAKTKFLVWLAPGHETKIMAGENGSIIYSPTDEAGNPQGQITYTPNDDGYQFGNVTMSKDTKIKTFREVTIIRYNGFPDNTVQLGDFNMEGNYVGARAWHKNPEEWICSNLVGLVIRPKYSHEVRPGVIEDSPGVIVFITPELNGRNPDIDKLAPTVKELYYNIGSDFYNTAVSFLQKPVSYLEDLVNQLGITMRVDFDTPLMKAGFVKMEENINFSYNGTEFWSRTKGTTVFMGLKTRYVSTLSGKQDWYTIQKGWNPKKRVIFFQYF